MSLSISISISIFSIVTLSISIFSKRVDISIIDMAYRYIEHPYVHLLFGNMSFLLSKTLSVKNPINYLRCHMRKKLKSKKWSDVDNADISKHFQKIFENI